MMKRMVLGMLALAALALAAAAIADPRDARLAQRTATAVAPAVAGSELIVVPAVLGEKSQVLTVVDPRQRVICVYHIELATGRIALKSVRNIHWDLQIDDLNNEKPLPQEIRSMAEPR